MKNSAMINLDDISDSVEVLHEKPRKFMVIFVYLLMALLSAVFLYAYFGQIDEYVKASGIVRPSETISEVIIPASGNVIEVNISPGRTIKRGEILLKTDDSLFITAISTLNSQKNVIEHELMNLEKLRKSVEEGENLFEKEIAGEQEYYYIFQQYYLKLQTNKEQYENSNTELARAKNEVVISANNSSSRIKELNSELSQCNLFKSSIETNENMLNPNFPNYDMYTMQFNDYLLITEQYESELKEANKAIENAEMMYGVGGSSLHEVETAKSKYDALEYQQKKYIGDYLAEIQQTIETITKNINDLEKNVRSSNSILQYYPENGLNTELAHDYTQAETIVEINSQIKVLKNQLESVEKEISDFSFNLGNTIVKSPIDGTVEFYTEVNIGDFVGGGTKLARVIPMDSGNLKITVYIANSDITEIFEGQAVKLRFSALPYKDYGEFSALISHVSTDSHIDKNISANYYLAEAMLNIDSISEEDIGLIKSGMDCEVKVITKQRNILTWVLHKLNFWED
jgi:hypothetical protein